MAGNTIVVSVLAETSNFRKGMQSLGDMGRKIGAAVGAVTIAAGAGLAALGVAATGAASNLQQSMGAVDAVFKDNSDAVHKWAQGAAQNLGLSRNQYSEFASVVGSQLKNMGIPMSEVTGHTNDLITKGADLAAQFGGTTADAVQALSAAFRGETDPIEKYGVSIKAADVEAQKAKMGLTGLTGEADKQATAMATLALINKQTADATGAFGRESETFAGQTQRLTAQFEDMKAKLGDLLLPVLTQLVTWVNDSAGPAFDTLLLTLENDIIPAFERFGAFLRDEVQPALQGFADWVVANKDPIGVIAAVVTGAAVAFGLWQGAIALWTTVTTIATAVQAAFNAVLAMNPIMLVVIALAALVAGLVYFFTQTETGRQAWATFTGALKSAWDATVKFFSTTLDNVKAWFKGAGDNVKNTWEGVKSFFSELPGKIRQFFSDAANWLIEKGRGILDGLKRGATDAWNGVVAWFQGIPSKVQGALGDAGSILSNAGRAVMDGFLGGLKATWAKVTDFVGGIADWIARNKGPIAKDKKLLTPAGAAIMGGFLGSLKDGYSDVQAFMRSVAPELAGSLDGVALAAPAGANVTVYQFDGLGITTAGEDESNLLAEFVAFARRKARAA